MTNQIDELITFPVRWDANAGRVIDASGAAVLAPPWHTSPATDEILMTYAANALNEKHQRDFPGPPELAAAGFVDIGGGVWKRKDVK